MEAGSEMRARHALDTHRNWHRVFTGSLASTSKRQGEQDAAIAFVVTDAIAFACVGIASLVHLDFSLADRSNVALCTNSRPMCYTYASSSSLLKYTNS